MLCVAVGHATEVQELDDLSFDQFVNGTGAWMVNVYAPCRSLAGCVMGKTPDVLLVIYFYSSICLVPWSGCSHCKSMAPIWEEVAQAVAPHGVRLGKAREKE